MKKILMISVFMIIGGISLLAQAPPAPPSSANQGGTGPVGGGAPIGSGMVFLISLAVGYGGKKVYNFSKRKLAD